MKYLNYLAVLLLCMIWSCEGKDNNDGIIKEITTPVNALIVDKNNTRWIGTNEGLYKSIEGGYELQKLSVAGKVYSLYYETASDILWIGTESSLLKAPIVTNDITDDAIPANQLSNPKVLAMHIDEGSKRWFGTLKGFSLNDKDIWKKENFRVNSENTIFAMDIEEFTVNSIASWEGDYFFATSGAKLYRAFDYNDTLDAFTGATQWDAPYNGQGITDTMFVVYVDREGKQWMGGKEGLQVHTGHDPKFQNVNYYEELPDYYILTINQAPDGDIWVGTRKGIGIYDGSDWTVLTNGLPDLNVTSIAFDKDGSAWIGTKKGLVNIL
jgi:ligand-binding sensor domain-containing protein